MRRYPTHNDQAPAYKAGFNAGLAGICWKANPFPTLSLQHLAWANGHIAGMDCAHEERRQHKPTLT